MSYYAVAVGRVAGIYQTWVECEKQVKGFSGAKYKKFLTRNEAEEFIEQKVANEKTVVSKKVTNEKKQKIDKKIIVFTDGACPNNGKPNARASWACVFPFYPDFNRSGLLEGPVQTNNRAEFTAFIKAYEVARTIDDNKPIQVYSDSKLLVQSINEWIPIWKNNKWNKSNGQQVENLDLVREIATIIEDDINISHVLAHTGGDDFYSIWNDAADRMAVDKL